MCAWGGLASLFPSSITTLWRETDIRHPKPFIQYVLSTVGSKKKKILLEKNSWVLWRYRPIFYGFIITYIIFAHVFIYHYVCTPKLGSFKQHTFMNSEFLRVKNPGVTQLGDSGSDSLWGWSQDTCWGCSNLKTWLGWRIAFQVHSRGCWQEISAPHHVGLSIE